MFQRDIRPSFFILRHFAGPENGGPPSNRGRSEFFAGQPHILPFLFDVCLASVRQMFGPCAAFFLYLSGACPVTVDTSLADAG